MTIKIVNFIKTHKVIIIIAFILSAIFGVLMNYIVQSNISASNQIIEVERIREKDRYEKVLNHVFKDFETLKVFVLSEKMDFESPKFTINQNNAWNGYFSLSQIWSNTISK